MVLRALHDLRRERAPLVLEDLPVPAPRAGEVLVRVAACGVCHTDLDVIEGRTPPGRLPLVPGHQVVGTVAALGEGCSLRSVGERVGIAWINGACGSCAFCAGGRENLCPDFRATGRDADGGYAEYAVVREGFAVPLPAAIDDVEAAPLLCAGAIGWRALRLAGPVDGGAIGLVGFGASGHLVLRVVRRRFPRSRVHVFSRTPGERAFALEEGAAWAGDFGDAPPEPLDCAIDTTPAWAPVVAGLRALGPGGRLVVNAIRKEDADKGALAGLDYPRDLWMEKELVSVANIARADVAEFLAFAAAAGIRPEVEVLPLAEANRALLDLKERRIRGAKVLVT
ncbi:MAG TPA: zinc-binding alcohol dehydrogenase family protein [bacterium]